ncbi:hypothetical protein CLV84_2549 [Neolewinella xylanilytica]|uniref:Uncharacterized protein n=1 Tax=Neolewinella xylanilytica TaxID=1514080 RepID=A0A2S6I389_9BACT|nr:hypothetical protein [Neolewinella xylanilytica]PPK85646.1 hypothetical protein CLV84_2549 [Neolewinella xylanilytica]
MNLESAKQNWQQIDKDIPPLLPADHLEVRWSHPALRALRRQLLFEGGCWSFFLILFYSGLDGDQRPWGWTAALGLSLVLLILHAIVGYRLAGRPVGAMPLYQAMAEQIRTIRRYSWLSIGLRILTLLILFGFLLSYVPALWNTPRLWAIGTIVVWTAVALFIHYRLWRGRINALQTTLDELKA